MKHADEFPKFHRGISTGNVMGDILQISWDISWWYFHGECHAISWVMSAGYRPQNITLVYPFKQPSLHIPSMMENLEAVGNQQCLINKLGASWQDRTMTDIKRIKCMSEHQDQGTKHFFLDQLNNPNAPGETFGAFPSHGGYRGVVAKSESWSFFFLDD